MGKETPSANSSDDMGMTVAAAQAGLETLRMAQYNAKRKAVTTWTVRVLVLAAPQRGRAQCVTVRALSAEEAAGLEGRGASKEADRFAVKKRTARPRRAQDRAAPATAAAPVEAPSMTVCAACPAPRGWGALSRTVTTGYCRILPTRDRKILMTDTENEIRTALRQAGAITAVDGQHLTRQRLGLAHRLYDAMLRLEPAERSRRVRLIDSIFSPSPPRRSAP